MGANEREAMERLRSGFGHVLLKMIAGGSDEGTSFTREVKANLTRALSEAQVDILRSGLTKGLERANETMPDLSKRKTFQQMLQKPTSPAELDISKLRTMKNFCTSARST